MGKKKDYDFSDFDKEVTEYDFEDFDQEITDEDIANTAKSTRTAAVTGAGIYAGQRAIKKSGIANKISELPGKMLEKMGELDSRQLKMIKDNPDLYRKGPDLEQLVTEGEDIEQSMQKGIFGRKKAAEDLIIAKDIELPKADLEKRLEGVKDIQKYRSSEKGLKEGTKIDKELVKLETKITPIQDGLSEIKTQANSAKTTVKDTNNLIDKRMNQLDRDLQVSTGKEKSSLIKQKKELQLQKRELKQRSTKIELESNKVQKSKGKDLQKLKSEYESLKAKRLTLPTDSKINVPEIEGYVGKEKGFLKGIESPKGQETVDMLKRVRSDADYNKALGTESFSNKAAKQYSKEIRSMIGEKSPAYDKLMSSSSAAIKDRDEFAKLIGLKGSTKTGQPLKATNSTVSRLLRLVENPDSPDFKRLQELASKYSLDDFLTKAELSAINKSVEKSTGLKNIRLGDILKGSVLASATGAGPVVGSAIAAKQALGTKAQEMIALASGSDLFKGKGMLGGALKGLGKAAKGIGKVAYKSLPIIGAAASFSEAQAAGLGPLETAGYVVAEEINPLPVSTLEMKDFVTEELPKRTKQFRADMEASDAKFEKLARELKEQKSNKVNKIDKLKNLENLQGTINKLKSQDSTASSKYAEELQAVQGQDIQQQNTTLMGLMQQPAFRELLRRTEKDNGEEIN